MQLLIKIPGLWKKVYYPFQCASSLEISNIGSINDRSRIEITLVRDMVNDTSSEISQCVSWWYPIICQWELSGRQHLSGTVNDTSSEISVWSVMVSGYLSCKRLERILTLTSPPIKHRITSLKSILHSLTSPPINHGIIYSMHQFSNASPLVCSSTTFEII